MIHGRPRLPLVGEQVHALMRLKAKNKTFLRRENQQQVGGVACLPLVGPEPSKNHKKGDPTPAHLPAGFQAHPSMRICWRLAERVLTRFGDHGLGPCCRLRQG
jgi:hypothetical protein